MEAFRLAWAEAGEAASTAEAGQRMLRYAQSPLQQDSRGALSIDEVSLPACQLPASCRSVEKEQQWSPEEYIREVTFTTATTHDDVKVANDLSSRS